MSDAIATTSRPRRNPEARGNARAIGNKVGEKLNETQIDGRGSCVASGKLFAWSPEEIS